MLRVNNLIGFGGKQAAAHVTTLPAFVAAGPFSSGTGSGTFNLPAGYQANDIFIAFVETADETVTPPSGWVEAPSSPISYTSGGLTRLTVFWKRAVASEGSTAFADPGDHFATQTIAIRGCITSGNPFDVTNNGSNGSSTGYTINGATTTVDNCLVITAIASGRDATSTGGFSFTNADLANLTARMGATSAAGSGGGVSAATGEKATAGTYGTTTGSFAVSIEWAGWTGALKPA
jgi:hypothetical protein